MPDGGLDVIVVTQILVDRLGLGRGFDDDQGFAVRTGVRDGYAFGARAAAGFGVGCGCLVICLLLLHLLLLI